MSGFLICFHVQANAGYAIEPLETVFYEVATEITGNNDNIHLGYKNYDNGKPRWLKGRAANLVHLNYNDMSRLELDELATYIKNNSIEYVLAFDLPVGANIIKAFRNGGARYVFSYYGAPISSINHGIKLLVKRIQVMCAVNKPDYFIFESHGMQRTATHGRGISQKFTSVVRLGIDVGNFISCTDTSLVYKEFDIPSRRKIIFYAGHMEKRKGVDVIVKAAATHVNKRNRDDLHFLICGNRPGEEDAFYHLYKNTPAEGYITFGGYRNDIPELMAGCYAAVIASTGWDSFPRTSLEMAAAGLPLLVSDLPGLNETIAKDVTGLLFKPGDHNDLADKLTYLSTNTDIRERFSKAAVTRIRDNFTLDIQRSNLMHTIQKVIQGTGDSPGKYRRTNREA